MEDSENKREIRLLTQDDGSSTCGQHCLAMISGKTVDEVCKLIGRKGGTRTVDMVKGLRILGFECDTKLRPLKQTLSGTVLLHIRFYNTTKSYWGHWALYHNRTVYDPGRLVPYNLSSYLISLENKGGRLTSILKIEV